MSARSPVREQAPAIRRALLRWYDAHQRPLPWRRTPANAYHVWISEIMLQQTRVAAALDHYRRFLKKFSSVRALARASEADVLAVWSGLGYYRRARMLHAAASTIVNDHGGRLPQNEGQWRALPGIGRYTAAAIASICLHARTAVVDGNVERVLHRLTGKRFRPEGLWKAANDLLAPRRPGDFNQSMMELGALVCTPKSPACKECPLFRWCATRGEHRAQRKESRRRIVAAYALAQRKDRVWLVQRPYDHSLMAGMWELPETVARGEPCLRLKHSITNTDIAVSVFRARPARSSRGKWVRAADAVDLPLTGLTRKILRRVGLL
ncbi:MAG: A/G-specific adenine glycosylase [Acidobacteriales bacterium]|nr:A/G-specific adenine glycosylase [Terriglobales bacterium]